MSAYVFVDAVDDDDEKDVWGGAAVVLFRDYDRREWMIEMLDEEIYESARHRRLEDHQ